MKRNESNINTWSGKMEPEAISYWMQEADKSAALGIGVGIDAKSLYEICDLALRATDLDEKYGELIMAVAKKHPGETRHDTALRYIQQAEEPNDEPERAAQEDQP